MRNQSALISELIIYGIVILPFLAGCGGSTASTGGGGNPVPTINSILPASTVAGNAAGFTLTIYGRNFVAGSTISFGGTTPTHTYVSPTQLTATIPAAAIASVGSLVVTVTDSALGRGTSNPVNFTIYPSSSSGTFTPTGNMTTARADHTATLLPNGKVLIAGGWDSFQALASAELYDPSTGMFTPTGHDHCPNWAHRNFTCERQGLDRRGE